MHFNNRKLLIIIHLITTPLHVCTVCGISEEFHDPWQHINYFIAALPKNKMLKKPLVPSPFPQEGHPFLFPLFPSPLFFSSTTGPRIISITAAWPKRPKHPFCIFLCTVAESLVSTPITHALWKVLLFCSQNLVFKT